MNIFVFKDRNNTEAGYIQITEEELQTYKENTADKVYLINLGHSIMETDEEGYRAYYKQLRREKYLREEAKLAGGVVSLNAIDSDELDGVGVVVDTSEPFEERIARKIMIEKLPEALSTLTDEEKELTYQIYFNHISERDLLKIWNIPRKTLSYRREKALLKLRKFFEE